MGKGDWLRGLNPQQREAVEAIEGPVLVLAGAGSGKTRVITHRVAHMLTKGIPAENILAVTFTNKAAAEMRERLAAMVGPPAAAVTMSTFHSLGLAMLREEATRRKRNTRFVIYDAGDQLALLREIAGRLRLGRSFDLQAVAARIGAWKNAFVDPGRVEPGDDEYAQAAAAFYPAYQEALDAFCAVDFDDLIVKPTRMMERSAACRERWAERFGWVLVDEYQDTNSAQLRMLRAIAGQHRNLCVVGDDDQSIYGWRGAEVRNILRFEADFEGCRAIHLARNYRSVGRVLDLANAVIALNEQRHPKQMAPVREPGPPIRLVVLEDGEAEASWVAERIEERISSHRNKPGQIAVLYRSNTLARSLETALRTQRLPYRVLGGKSFFDRKEVKDLIAYLRVCANPADGLSLRRVINFPARGVGPGTLAKLAAWADEQDVGLWRAVEQAERILAPKDRALQGVVAFRDLIHRIRPRLRRGRDLAGGVEALVADIDLKAEVHRTCNTGKAFDVRWGLVEEFLAGLRAYSAKAAKPSLREYLGQVSLTEQEKDADDTPGDRITLSTLHGAKGLEWELVFMVGLEEGLLPHDRVLNPQVTEAIGSDLAEERRLCYVGITRARDELVMTRAAKRVLHGKPRPRAPSRFVAELPATLLEVRDLAAPLEAADAKQRLAQIKEMLSR